MMSPLREQLQSARREYESIRFPGDLSRQVFLPPVRPRGTFLLTTLGAGAAAAAAVLATLLARPVLTPAASHSRSYVPLVKEIRMPSQMNFELPSLPSVPGMPSHLSLREMAPSLVPPDGIELPSLDDLRVPTFSDNPEHA